MPTFKHEMYSHLHDEYRATAARGKSATFRRLQLQEEMSAAHANGLAWGSPWAAKPEVRAGGVGGFLTAFMRRTRVETVNG